jgi:type II secretory pathway component PulM
MSGRLIDALLRRTPRERLLLALVTFLVLPVGVAVGLLEPLARARMDALHGLEEELNLNSWIRARISEQERLAAVSADGTTQARSLRPIGISAVEQSLVENGLRDDISTLGAGAVGTVELGFDEVDFSRFANWLSQSHPGWGYEVESLRIDATDRPSVVAVRLSLRPWG